MLIAMVTTMCLVMALVMPMPRYCSRAASKKQPPPQDPHTSPHGRFSLFPGRHLFMMAQQYKLMQQAFMRLHHTAALQRWRYSLHVCLILWTWKFVQFPTFKGSCIGFHVFQIWTLHTCLMSSIMEALANTGRKKALPVQSLLPSAWASIAGDVMQYDFDKRAALHGPRLVQAGRD